MTGGFWWGLQGQIVEFDPAGCFFVLYDDGQSEWIDLTEHRFQWLTPRGVSTGGASADLLSLMVYLRADNLGTKDGWDEFRKKVEDLGTAAQARLEPAPLPPQGWEGHQPAQEDLVGSIISVTCPGA